MTISNLPPSPSRADDPAGFSSKMDALLGALPQFVSETNATAADVSQDKIDVALIKSQTEGVRTDAIVQTDAIRDDAILQTSSLRDTTLGYRNEAQAAAGQAAGYRDESQTYRDGAQAAAAAAGSAAGLPSLVGKAKKALTVLPGEDGVGWATATAEGFQEFASSGTWTKPAEATWVYVEAIGGGASGGARVGSESREIKGGGGGGFVARVIRGQDVTSSVVVTVGAGGSAVSRGTSGNSVGLAGGDSSFGVYAIGRGGRGGDNPGGGGGEKGGVDGATTGDPGDGGYSSGGGGAGAPGGSCVMGGGGGGGAFGNSEGGASAHGGSGGAGKTSPPPTTATSGVTPGGGGGGAISSSTGTTISGAGGDGRVRVWWW